VLATEGALTATEAGELIGESPTTCSFHFRQLEKYGFTEIAATGPGRQRRWKIAQVGMNFSDATDDAELNIAAASLSRLVTDRAIARMQRYQETKSNYSREWQEASESTEAVLFVTPQELSELNDEILTLLTRFHARLTDVDQRPEGSLPVEVLVFRYPVRFSGAGQ
ncbi:MAG: hypothetical protein ABSG58_02315, partial [Acidimicrobiales bacterium]